MKKETLIICPVYNEGDTIRTFFEDLRDSFREDILFVDDGSTDKSRDFLEYVADKNTFLVRHSERHGYGETLINGFNFALKNRYRKVLTIDVDLQHDPAQIPAFLNGLEDYDVVLGSRYMRQGIYDDIPTERFLINRYIARVIESLFSVKFTDPFCGFRAYKDSFLKRARFREKSYGFALEVLLEIIRIGATFKETPVKAIYFDRPRKFLDGLDDPNMRFFYYLNVVLKKHEEIKGEKKIFNSKPPSR